MASTVTQQVQQGIPISTIFEYVAQERQNLARRMRSPPITDFGHRREKKQGKFWLHSHVSFVNPDDQTDLEYALFSELIKPILRQGGSRQRLNTQRYPRNIYHSSQRHPIRTSQLFANEQTFRIRHPINAKADTIFADVLFRLELIRSFVASGASPNQFHQEFLAAMQGYYMAVSYQRGSSSIGQVFFEGFYLAVFGKKMPFIPDGIDVLAMILSPADFIDTFWHTFTAPPETSPPESIPTAVY